jgi:hypothetical protein
MFCKAGWLVYIELILAYRQESLTDATMMYPTKINPAVPMTFRAILKRFTFEPPLLRRGKMPHPIRRMLTIRAKQQAIYEGAGRYGVLSLTLRQTV